MENPTSSSWTAVERDSASFCLDAVHRHSAPKWSEMVHAGVSVSIILIEQNGRFAKSYPLALSFLFQGSGRKSKKQVVVNTSTAETEYLTKSSAA